MRNYIITQSLKWLIVTSQLKNKTKQNKTEEIQDWGCFKTKNEKDT